jgi:hypothetical protein
VVVVSRRLLQLPGAAIISSMDILEDIRRRSTISSLQARRDLLVIEREALARELDSPRTSLARRIEAFDLCNDLADRWAEIVEELNAYEGEIR